MAKIIRISSLYPDNYSYIWWLYLASNKPKHGTTAKHYYEKVQKHWENGHTSES